MKKIVIIIFYIFNISGLASQTTFDLLIQSNENKELENMLEFSNGDIIYCGGIDIIDTGFGKAKTGYLVKTNKYGELILEKRINIKDSFLRFQNLYLIDNNSFIVFAISGNVDKGYANKLLYQVYDLNFNLLESKTLNTSINDIDIIINKAFKDSDNNFILTGTTLRQRNKNPDYEMFFYKVSFNGDSISSNFVFNDDYNFETSHSIIQKKYGNGYYALTHGHESTGQVFNLNENLDIISYRAIPTDIGNYGTIKWFNDTSYIISGWDYLDDYNSGNFEQDIGVIILDTLHNIIKKERFGQLPDTVDTPAPFNSIVYDENDEFIYIGGTSNMDFFQMFFGNQDSYIYFIKVNRSLEPIFEKFYKGDAYYFVSNFSRLADGGFMFLTTRYDHIIQNNERDIYILKVDADGNLPVSIEEPKIKVQELILYPNPGINQINIKTAVQYIGGVFTMYDMFGKLIFQQNITKSITKISTEHISSGAYICKYNYNGKVIQIDKWIKNNL